MQVDHRLSRRQAEQTVVDRTAQVLVFSSDVLTAPVIPTGQWWIVVGDVMGPLRVVTRGVLCCRLDPPDDARRLGELGGASDFGARCWGR